MRFKLARLSTEFSRTLFWLILSFAFILRLIVLFKRPLSSDEVWTISMLKNNLLEIIYGSLADFRPPLYYLITLIWSKFFGLSLISIRLVSLVASLISGVFIYKTALLISDLKQALIAYLLAGISAGLIYDAGDARMTSTAFCFTAILLWSVTSYIKKRERKYLIFIGISGTLACYSYYYSLFLLPFIIILFRSLKSRAYLTLSIFYILILIPLYSGALWSIKYASSYHSYLINNPLKTAAIFFIPFFPSELIIFELIHFAAERLIIYILLVVLAIFLSLIIFRIVFLIKKIDSWLLIVFCIAPLIILSLISFFWRSIISVHTIVIFALPFYLLIPRLLTKSKHLLLIFFMFCGVLTGFYLLQIDRTKPDLNYLETVRFSQHPTDIVLVNNVYPLLWLKYFNPNIQVFAYIPSAFNAVIEHSLGYKIIDIDRLDYKDVVVIEMPNKKHFLEAFTSKNSLDFNYNLISENIYTNAHVYRYHKKSVNN